jgi:diadenosine tetraphosphate (Ap4A) HIT family hydrolase
MRSDIPTALVAVNNSRSAEQSKQMRQAAETGKCPFCHINWTRNKLIKEGEFWYLMYNLYPYPGQKQHLVLVLKRHFTSFEGLAPEERLEWFSLNEHAMREFNIPGGALVMRFGDLDYSAGTIAHLHSHIQVPDLASDAFVIAVFKKNKALETFLAPKK